MTPGRVAEGAEKRIAASKPRLCVSASLRLCVSASLRETSGLRRCCRMTGNDRRH